MKQRCLLLLRLGAGGCLLGGLLLLLLVEHSAERHWLAVALLYLPPGSYLLAAAGLLLVAGACRRWWEALAGGVGLLLLLLGPADFRIPLPGRPVPGGEPLRVVTWNLHGARQGAKAVAATLAELDADVFLLQEAGTPEALAALGAAFDGWQVTQAGGLAIASRHPLSQAETRPLGGYRECLLARLQIDERELRLVNVHFSTAAPGRSLARSGRRFPAYLEHTAAVRREQAQALRALVDELGGPAVVGGDFNTPPRRLPLRLLSGELTDAVSAGRGFGFTYSTARPLWRIDHVLATPDLRPASWQALPTRASDHRPVLVEVRLPPE